MGSIKQLLKEILREEIDSEVETESHNKTGLTFLKSPTGLSDQEGTILRLIAYHVPNDLIAKAMKLSRRTVEVHRYNISKKLNIDRDGDIIVFQKGI
jgi:DNA-binding CsgD family transcriptional regulator